LLRHAKSSWDDPALADHDRPLAPRGRRAATSMAAYIANLDTTPSLILCSTAARTRETLERVTDALPDGATVEYADQLYAASARGLLSRLRAVPDAVGTVLIVGHNPAIEELALRLTDSGAPRDLERMSHKFPTAACARLRLTDPSWAALDASSCELVSFMRPKDVAAH
jgi:phosphohistidine phosphatase